MNPPIATPISIVISNFNGGKVLPDTLAAIDRLNDPDLEVIVVDDGSTDQSDAWVEAHHPRVRLLRMGRNTRHHNIVRNRGLREAKNRYVMLMDNDIALNRPCLDKLLAVLKEHPTAMCCSPRLLFHDDPQRIYSDGSHLHYLALAAQAPRRVTVTDRPPSLPYDTLGGGIMMIDRHRAQRIGFFDEGYPFGCYDDGEFHLRGHISGMAALHVSEATALHVERSHGRERIFGQFYNRWRLLLCVYSTRSLIVLGPALFLFDLMLLVMALSCGSWREYGQALAKLARERSQILARRRQVQAMRTRPDSVCLVAGRIDVSGRTSQSRLMRWGAAIAEPIFNTYWRLARPLLGRSAEPAALRPPTPT